jgi:type IV pilus assembly protein PilE
MMNSEVRASAGGRAAPARGASLAGFTLIEVVIVMVIIAILAAVAIPAYTQYIARGHRSEARSTLLLAAQWMERFRTQNGTYNGAALPAGLQRSPASGTQAYAIAVGGIAANTYTLTATPQGPMNGDACGNLTLDQSGARGVTGTATMDLCWGR